MRVFGIDCGTEFTGYGVVESDDASRTPTLRYVASGTVRLDKRRAIGERLVEVQEQLIQHIGSLAPDVVCIEEVFFSANAKSALKLGQVRGVALLSAALCGRQVAEYAPLAIKNAVVGYGLASKEQVQFMVKQLLRIEGTFDSADAADALAIAICHLHCAQTLAHTGGVR